jgi:hypothetical protein
MKIRPVAVELFHAGGQTTIVTTKLIVAFRNFANEPKKRGGSSAKANRCLVNKRNYDTYVLTVRAARQLQLTTTVYLASSQGIRHYSGPASCAAGLYKHGRCGPPPPQGLST